MGLDTLSVNAKRIFGSFEIAIGLGFGCAFPFIPNAQSFAFLVDGQNHADDQKRTNDIKQPIHAFDVRTHGFDFKGAMTC